MLSPREDPRWQKAHAVCLAEMPELTATERMRRQVEAILEMYHIEVEYEREVST